MAGLLNIQLIGTTAVLAKLDRLGPSIVAALTKKVKSLSIELQRHVVQDKLSGQVLNVQTGNLRRSIQQKVEATATAVYGKVYSDGSVKYAGIHEYGGTIHMPPRAFQVRLRTTAGGDLMRQAQYGNLARFAKASHSRVSTRNVSHGGHDIQMPERSFLRSSLADQRESISTGLREAIAEGLKLGGGA